MSNEKCFCHLNGYKVKDADARKGIEEVKKELKNASADVTKKRFVLFGDSYLAGYQVGGTYAPTQSWGHKLKQRLGLNDEDCVLAGMTGGSFALAGGTHWQDQVDGLDVTNPETINYVVVVGGTNDYESTTDNIMSGVTLFAERCRAKFPNAKIVMGCIVGHTRHWGLAKTQATIYNYKKACMANRIAYMAGLEYTVRHMKYMQSDTLHVTESAQELICDGIENFLLGGAIDTKVYEGVQFSAPPNTEHTFSVNNLVTGINNGTAFLKNNAQTIVTLNGTTVYFNGAQIPIALIEHSDVVGRDDFPCQYPCTVVLQLAGGKTYMTASGYFEMRDTTLYLSLFKMKDDQSNFLDSIQPAAIIIPKFYFEHTLCMGI